MKPVDHLTTGIGAASIFEKCLTIKARLGKGRKLRAHKIHIKRCHGRILLAKSDGSIRCFMGNRVTRRHRLVTRKSRPGTILSGFIARGFRLCNCLFRTGMHRMTGYVAASRRALIVVRGAIASVSTTISIIAPVVASSARSNAAAKSSVRVTRSP